MSISKRQLTKAFSLSGIGATVWTKPMISSITLPAHAQTSFACGSEVVCDESTDGNDNEEAVDGLFVLFDGVSCRLETFPCCEEVDLPSNDDDRIIMVDIDVNEGDDDPTWDSEAGDVDTRSGANWDLTPVPGDDNPGGEYTFTARRLSGPLSGNEYTVFLSVDLEKEDLGNLTLRACGTVSVSITPVS